MSGRWTLSSPSQTAPIIWVCGQSVPLPIVLPAQTDACISLVPWPGVGQRFSEVSLKRPVTSLSHYRCRCWDWDSCSFPAVATMRSSRGWRKRAGRWRWLTTQRSPDTASPLRQGEPWGRHWSGYTPSSWPLCKTTGKLQGVGVSQGKSHCKYVGFNCSYDIPIVLE